MTKHKYTAGFARYTPKYEYYEHCYTWYIGS